MARSVVCAVVVLVLAAQHVPAQESKAAQATRMKLKQVIADVDLKVGHTGVSKSPLRGISAGLGAPVRMASEVQFSQETPWRPTLGGALTDNRYQPVGSRLARSSASRWKTIWSAP